MELELDGHAVRAFELDVDALIIFSAPGIVELLDRIAGRCELAEDIRHGLLIAIGVNRQRIAQDVVNVFSGRFKRDVLRHGIAFNLAHEAFLAFEAVVEALELHVVVLEALHILRDTAFDGGCTREQLFCEHAARLLRLFLVFEAELRGKAILECGVFMREVCDLGNRGTADAVGMRLCKAVNERKRSKDTDDHEDGRRGAADEVGSMEMRENAAGFRVVCLCFRVRVFHRNSSCVLWLVAWYGYRVTEEAQKKMEEV